MNNSWLPTSRKNSFDALWSPLEQIFEDFPLERSLATWTSSEFNAPANVEESENHYLLTLDVPGVKREDITIEAKDDSLYISGERKFSESGEKGKVHYRESAYGKFTKAFKLGNQADFANIEAELSDGVLRVSVAKKAEAKARKIAIK